MGASLSEFENKSWKNKYQDMLFENGIIDISSEMIHQSTSGLTLETGFSVEIIAFLQQFSNMAFDWLAAYASAKRKPSQEMTVH